MKWVNKAPKLTDEQINKMLADIHDLVAVVKPFLEGRDADVVSAALSRLAAEALQVVGKSDREDFARRARVSWLFVADQRTRALEAAKRDGG
jgi:hypothetical protein